MALANSQISDIIATTYEHRSKVLADNVTNNNVLLGVLKKRGNVRPFNGGRVIFEELMWDDPTTRTFQWYSGYETLNIAQNSPITAAQFDVKQAANSIVISGLEDLQNSGDAAVIDLLEGRMKVAEAQMMNGISAGIYSDGTGSGGKQITGLQAAVPDNPTTGVYGGIDRANFSFWRSARFRGVTDGGAAVSSANIQSYMNQLAVQLIRGNDAPDIIVADNNYYQFYLNSLQAIQRVTTEGGDTVGAGFPGLKYYGAGISATVYLDGGIQGAIPSNHMYFLNSNYLFFRPHSARNMVLVGGDRQSVNQDATVRILAWAGNMTSIGPRYNGVLIA